MILVTSIVNVSNHTKYIPLNNQQCTTQPALINLNPNEYNEGSRSYLFGVNLDRCIGTCNALNCLSNEVSAPNEKKSYT